MNVKKSGGGGSSKEHEINDYIKRDKKFIYNEIDIIELGTIIIGMSWASTVNLLFPDVKWKKTGYCINLCWYNQSKVIDFYHPSSRNGPATSYSLLQNVFQSKEFRNL